jgi:hypothetical protein
MQGTNSNIKFLVIGALLTVFVIAVYKAATRKPELQKCSRICKEAINPKSTTEQSIDSTDKSGETENTNQEV